MIAPNPALTAGIAGDAYVTTIADVIEDEEVTITAADQRYAVNYNLDTTAENAEVDKIVAILALANGALHRAQDLGDDELARKWELYDLEQNIEDILAGFRQDALD